MRSTITTQESHVELKQSAFNPKVVDTRDKRDLGLFLENEDNLVSYWGVIERARGQYNKCNIK